MAITLKHLCKYAKENYNMDQICGHRNMNNLVGWVHMLEDPETAYFLHGRELIFTTGIAPHDTAWFLEFAEGLVKNQASGWVINLGPYIESVPSQVIDYLIEHDFPLFTVPWETRLVDITNDFCHQIIKSEESETSIAGAFKKAIFFPNNSTQYKAILEGKGFHLDGYFSVMAIAISIPRGQDFVTFEKVVRLHLSKILFGIGEKFALFLQNKHLVVVMQDFEQNAIKEAARKLSKVCNYGGASFKIHSGISADEQGIETVSKSYKRAVEIMKMAKNQRKVIMTYQDIGILQLLIEIDDRNVLTRFYKDTIGRLDDYDDKHQSDYVYILKCYLDNNNSVEKVAKETYVHRNTINYKIKKIKEILNSDLTYKDGLKLLLAYEIKKMI